MNEEYKAFKAYEDREPNGGTLEAFYAGAEWQAARAASPVAEGWKLVPVEPTEAMLRAGVDWTNRDDSLYDTDGTKAIYRAMLAASPVAPAPTQQPAEFQKP
jgi:hypothetical protein